VPILTHTLRKFEEAATISNIILVVPREDIQYVEGEIVDKFGISKVTGIIAGGKERQHSIEQGLGGIDSDSEIVVIHDGVRPFVASKLIDTIVNRALEEGAVTLGVPVKDTVKSVNGMSVIEKTIARDTLWLTQTPQAFRREIIKKAYEKACKNNYLGTDDSCLVERIGVTVRMIMGTYDNIKITTDDDLIIGEALLEKSA
jgi:2-C-methyl-D-erythritol 4-phosphate cytidylyltransferase